MTSQAEINRICEEAQREHYRSGEWDLVTGDVLEDAPHSIRKYAVTGIKVGGKWYGKCQECKNWVRNMYGFILNYNVGGSNGVAGVTQVGVCYKCSKKYVGLIENLIDMKLEGLR